MIKAHFTGILVSNIVITSVHCEKTRLKKLIKIMMMIMIIIIIIIIIMDKSQEITVLQEPEIDFRHVTEARKVMVDFKFIAQ